MGEGAIALVALALAAGALAFAVVLAQRLGALARAGEGRFEPALARLDQGLRDEMARGRGEGAASAKLLREEVTAALTQLGDSQLRVLDSVRRTIEGRLDAMRADNAEKLERMRLVVEEKLQATLEQRLGASFRQVSEQLEQVFKSVGEMQSLAAGVGDLRRVLTNVKSRGTWGEMSLGTILDQVLAPEQYARNVEIRPGSRERVEYAIRLPGGDGEGPLWLPIDAKFPTEDYERLTEAAERADAAAVESAGKGLEGRVRLAARDIATKYVAPPHSTDFALLFLPTEGLYAEIIRRPGLIDLLQREHRIVVAGPTTLLALLNSLRMGFRTLAIQQRSSEVWQVLRAVRTEFARYGEALDRVQRKLSEASSSIDLMATRRRQVDRRLESVESLPEVEADLLLGLDGAAARPGTTSASAAALGSPRDLRSRGAGGG
jgi:DNA recombination protein RmuC